MGGSYRALYREKQGINGLAIGRPTTRDFLMSPVKNAKLDKAIQSELNRVRSSKLRSAADFRKHGVKPVNKREECIALCASLDAREHLLLELVEKLDAN